MEKLGLRVLAVAAVVVCLLALLGQLHARSRIAQLEHDLQRNTAALAVLTEANTRLSTMLRDKTPGPSFRPPSTSVTASTPTAETNLLSRLQHESQKLSIAKVEEYLTKAGRNAPNLLSAYRSSGDVGLLREAMEKYPNNPQVAFEAVVRPDLSAEERATWLNRLKDSAPDNPLGNYLSALDAFKNGRNEQALRELTAAAGKPHFQDYTLERSQNDQDLYLASGYSLAESKAIPTSQLLLPQLAQLKDLGNRINDLATSYRNAGDEASANAALEMSLQLASHYVDRFPGEPEVSKLVGMAIEYNSLKLMQPDATYPGSTQTVQQRMAQIDQERQDFRQLNDSVKDLMPRISEQDLIGYIDHRLLFGEPEALRWVLAKYHQ